MDYGRFRYEESRKERESRKKSKGATLKEVRMAPKIDEHDLQTKARQAQRFLEAGDKVKISVLHRGREMLHQDIGRNLLMQMAQQLSEVATLDQDPRMEGRSMSIMLSPRKTNVDRQSSQESRSREQAPEASEAEAASPGDS
jgi:translation initiation factor IF-3